MNALFFRHRALAWQPEEIMYEGIEELLPDEVSLDEVVQEDIRATYRQLFRYDSTKNHLMRRLHYLAWGIGRAIAYDDVHTRVGLRTAQQTYDDAAGNCVEKALLLRSAFELCEPETRYFWMITKNPRGHEGSGSVGGIHPFVYIKTTEYWPIFDGYDCEAKLMEGVARHGWEYLASVYAVYNDREFAAFYLGMSADDQCCRHDDLEGGLRSINRAIDLCPYQYPLYETKARILRQLGDEQEARKAMQDCVAWAPREADVHIANGWFLLEAEDNEGLRSFSHALKLQNADVQQWRFMDEYLTQRGEFALAAAAKEKARVMLADPRRRGYLDSGNDVRDLPWVQYAS